MITSKEQCVSAAATTAAEAALEIERAKLEVLMLKEASLSNQRQALEAKVAMEALNVELSRVNEVAASTPQQNVGSFQTVSQPIKEKEELCMEYQRQLEVIASSDSKIRSAHMVNEQMKNDQASVDLLLQNNQAQRNADAQRYVDLKQLSERRLLEYGGAENELSLLRSELEAGRKCMADLAKSDDLSQGASQLWNGMNLALRFNIDEPPARGDGADDDDDEDNVFLTQ